MALLTPGQNVPYFVVRLGGTLIFSTHVNENNPWYPKLPTYLGRELAVSQDMRAQILRTPVTRKIT